MRSTKRARQLSVVTASPLAMRPTKSESPAMIAIGAPPATGTLRRWPFDSYAIHRERLHACLRPPHHAREILASAQHLVEWAEPRVIVGGVEPPCHRPVEQRDRFVVRAGHGIRLSEVEGVMPVEHGFVDGGKDRREGLVAMAGGGGDKPPQLRDVRELRRVLGQPCRRRQ